MLNLIIKWSKSRTVWTVVVLFLLGGIKQMSDFLPNDVYTLLQGILTAMVIYFRANPRVE